MATTDYGSVQQREQLIQEPEPLTNRSRSASRTRASSHIDIPQGGSDHGSDNHEHSHDSDDGSFKAAVFGFSDGLCTNVNLVLGMYMALSKTTADGVTDPAHVSHLVTMTGLAGLFAGASSMASGEWLSAQAEQAQNKRELAHERWHLTNIPHTEHAHMKDILMNMGLSNETAEAVNRDVAALPIDDQVKFHGRFELGIEEDDENPIKNSLYMWVCFAIGALLPVLPWWITYNHRNAFIGTIVATVIGVAMTSLYQVRGHYNHLASTLLRQVLVTAVAVGVTVGFNVAFTKAE